MFLTMHPAMSMMGSVSFTMQDDVRSFPWERRWEGDYRSSTSCSYMYMYSRTFTSLGVVLLTKFTVEWLVKKAPPMLNVRTIVSTNSSHRPDDSTNTTK